MCNCWVRTQVVYCLTACVCAIFCNVLLMHVALVSLQVQPPFKSTSRFSTVNPTFQHYRIVRQADNESQPIDIGDNSDDLSNDQNVTATLVTDVIRSMATTPLPAASLDVRELSTTTISTTTPAPSTEQSTTGETISSTKVASVIDLLDMDGTRHPLNRSISEPSRTFPKLPNFWSATEEMWLIAVVGVCATLSCPIWLIILSSAGVRVPLFITTVASGLLTALRPFLFHISSLWPLFAIQALQGVALGIVLPAIGAVVHSWAQVRSRTTFVLTAVLGMAIAPMVMFSLIAFIVHFGTNTDHRVDYEFRQLILAIVSIACAIGTFIVALVWLLVDRDQPQKHPFITGQEIDRLLTGKGRILLDDQHQVSVPPLRALLSTGTGWALLCACWVRCLAFVWLVYAAPVIVRDNLPQVDFVSNCLHVGTSFLLHSIVLALLLVFGNRLMLFRNETSKVRSFNFASHFLTGASLAVMCLLHVLNGLHLFPTNCFVLAALFLAFDGAGCWRALTIHSGRYCGGLLAVVGVLLGVAWVIVPCVLYVCGWLWAQTGLAVLLMVSSILFLLLAEAQPAKWTEQALVGTNMNENETDDISIEAGVIQMRTITSDRI